MHRRELETLLRTFRVVLKANMSVDEEAEVEAGGKEESSATVATWPLVYVSYLRVDVRDDSLRCKSNILCFPSARMVSCDTPLCWARCRLHVHLCQFTLAVWFLYVVSNNNPHMRSYTPEGARNTIHRTVRVHRDKFERFTQK